LNPPDNPFLTSTVFLYDWLNQPGYLSLFSLSFLASTLIPLGSEWLLVMMLVKSYPPLGVILIATAGNYLGALTTYLIGVWGSEWLISRVLRISAEDRRRAGERYRRYGAVSLLFSWLPVIGDPLCLIGGIMRTNFWLFTALVAAGKLCRYAAVDWIALR